MKFKYFYTDLNNMIRMTDLIQAHEFHKKFNNFGSAFSVIGEVGLSAEKSPLGRYGRVYHIQDNQTQKHYAYKVYNKYKNPENTREISINRSSDECSLTEGNIIKDKSLPYVIKYYGLYNYNDSAGMHSGVLMDFFDGQPLNELIPRVQSSMSISTNSDLEIDEFTLLKITYKILVGLSALHELEIAHRDIKLDNILCREDSLTQTYDIRIIDLGFAGNNSKQFPLKSRRGTAFYMAPEILTVIPESNLPVPASQLIPGDIWALGVCLYVLTNNGEFPFDADNMAQLIQILSSELKIYLINQKMPTINKIICDCMLPFGKRPSAKELLEKYFCPV